MVVHSGEGSMIRTLTFIVALTVAAPAGAQDFDDTVYYRVSGVAADDSLNVRLSPDGSSEILGQLAHDAGPVEVVQARDGWAMVTVEDQAGWVAMRYLERVDVGRHDVSDLPVGLQCGGTEPFWNVSVTDEAVEFSALGAMPEDQSFDVEHIARAHSIGFPAWFDLSDGASAWFEPRMCSDGMSEIAHGWTAHIVIEAETGPYLYSGCCRLPMD